MVLVAGAGALGQRQAIHHVIRGEVAHALAFTSCWHGYKSFLHWFKSECRALLTLPQCSDPFVRDGIELVSMKVKGQSFMLHQIRKMIGRLCSTGLFIRSQHQAGTAMAVVRGYTGADVIERSFGPARVRCECSDLFLA